MVAIVKIGGQQWRAEASQVLRVPKLDASPGETVDLDVLCIVDGQRVEFGHPYVEGIKARARVLSHGNGDNILVFKKKRRKNYQVKRGHRQAYTEIQFEGIVSMEAASPPPEIDSLKAIGKSEVVKTKSTRPRRASPKVTNKREIKEEE